MNSIKGFVSGILTSVTFGLIPLFTLPLMEKGMLHDSILFYRFLLASVTLAIIMVIKKESFGVSRKNLPILLLLGLFYTCSALFLFWGYSFMSAGIATTLHFTYPVFVTLIMLIFFREKTSIITFIAIALAIAGVARLSISSDQVEMSVFGVIIVLLSALAYGLYIVTVNKSDIQNLSGRKLTFFVFIISTTLFAIKAGLNEGIQPIPDSSCLINLILLAIVPTVISNITLVVSVRHIGGTLTSVLGAVEPITAVIIGILIFGEPFTPQLALGIGLIIIAVTLIILSKFIQQFLRTCYAQLIQQHFIKRRY